MKEFTPRKPERRSEETMTELKLINPEHVSEEEAKTFRVREACRAIVSDDDGLIALLYVANEDYYKLPGGGIEKGEEKLNALQRECLEEIGCDVEVISEVGSITEYRKIFKIKQISYCYLAKVKGPKGISNLTTEEIDKGFKQVWLAYPEAMQAMIKSDASSLEGSAYIVPRDTALLKEAGTHLIKP